MNASSSVKGVLAMALSMALFMANDTLLKLAMQDVPLSEAMALRSVLTGVILFVVLARGGMLPLLPLTFRTRVLARSALDTVTTLLYLAALAVMPIASTTTIYLAAPLITIALAVPMLGEKVSPIQWCAIIVGFLGAVIVMRPEPASFHFVALLPLVAAVTGSVRDISTRGIGKEVPGAVVGFSANLALGVGALFLALFEPWRAFTTASLLYVAAASLAFSAATLALVFAFRNAPVSAVSPLRYLLVFGAVISGVLVFGDVPDAWSWVGIALVVGAGLYSLNLEHQRSVKARRAAHGGAPAQPLGACAAPSD